MLTGAKIVSIETDTLELTFIIEGWIDAASVRTTVTYDRNDGEAWTDGFRDGPTDTAVYSDDEDAEDLTYTISGVRVTEETWNRASQDASAVAVKAAKTLDLIWEDAVRGIVDGVIR